MYIKLLRSFLFLAFIVTPALAQDALTPEKAELIGRFAELTKGNKTTFKVDVSLDHIKANMIALVDKDPELTEPQKEVLRKTAEESFARLTDTAMRTLNGSNVLNKLGLQVVTDVYNAAFTEAELKELVTFFEGPLGQRALTFMSTSRATIERIFKEKMQAKMIEISQPIVTAELDKLQEQIKKAKTPQ